MGVQLTLLIALLAASPPVVNTPPEMPSVVFGMSTVLSGPAAELGQGMKAGVEAAFAEANRDNGIRGRPLELIALDDGYEPSRTGPNVRTLIDERNVVAIIGNVGTPTAVATLPIINEERTVFFGAFTGAGLLRKDPPDREVINYRASYAEETGAMVDALVEHAGLKPTEIAFFTQRDAYGDAGFAGGIAALKRHGLERETSVPHGRYERNTLAVENALADILSANTEPRAIIMVGTYAPCAAFIKLARAIDPELIFLNVSFVGAPALAAAGGEAVEGVIVTQVVPPPMSDLPIAREYRAALRAIEPEHVPCHVSFEGYIAARIMIRALRESSAEPTRENIADALLSLGDFDIGLGHTLHLSPKRRQASTMVWPTIIRSGAVEPFDWTMLAPAHVKEASEEAGRR